MQATQHKPVKKTLTSHVPLPAIPKRRHRSRLQPPPSYILPLSNLRDLRHRRHLGTPVQGRTQGGCGCGRRCRRRRTLGQGVVALRAARAAVRLPCQAVLGRNSGPPPDRAKALRGPSRCAACTVISPAYSVFTSMLMCSDPPRPLPASSRVSRVRAPPGRRRRRPCSLGGAQR